MSEPETTELTRTDGAPTEAPTVLPGATTHLHARIAAILAERDAIGSAVRGDPVSEATAEAFSTVREAMDLRAERDDMAARMESVLAERSEAHAELDKHGAPAGEHAHTRIRALMVDKLRAAEAIVERAREEIAKARMLARRRLPDERKSVVYKFCVGGQEGYLIVGLYETGAPGEMFLRMGKGQRELSPQEVSALISGLSDCFATAVSIALQYGAPLDTLVAKFAHTKFEPAGATGNAALPSASSLADHWFRWMAKKFLPDAETEPTL